MTKHVQNKDKQYIYIYIYIIPIGDFKTTADRLICEQTFIHKLIIQLNVLVKIYHFSNRTFTFNLVDHFCFFDYQQLTGLTSITKIRLFLLTFNVSKIVRNDTGFFKSYVRLCFGILFH